MSLLTDVVIPCSCTAINLIGVGYEVLEAVDAIGTQHIIALSKDCVAYLALSRAIKLTTIGVGDVGRLVKLCCTCAVRECAVLNGCLDRVYKSSLLESLVEDGVAFQTVEGVAKQTRGAWHYPIELVYQTIGHLVVLAYNSSDIVQHRTAERVNLR